MVHQMQKIDWLLKTVPINLDFVDGHYLYLRFLNEMKMLYMFTERLERGLYETYFDTCIAPSVAFHVKAKSLASGDRLIFILLCLLECFVIVAPLSTCTSLISNLAEWWLPGSTGEAIYGGEDSGLHRGLI